LWGETVRVLMEDKGLSRKHAGLWVGLMTDAFPAGCVDISRVPSGLSPAGRDATRAAGRGGHGRGGGDREDPWRYCRALAEGICPSGTSLPLFSWNRTVACPPPASAYASATSVSPWLTTLTWALGCLASVPM
jgi:hypothetical protein